MAGSARGRDLRAAAALARFEPVKKEEVVIKKEESETESETEDEAAGLKMRLSMWTGRRWSMMKGGHS